MELLIRAASNMFSRFISTFGSYSKSRGAHKINSIMYGLTVFVCRSLALRELVAISNTYCLDNLLMTWQITPSCDIVTVMLL